EAPQHEQGIEPIRRDATPGSRRLEDVEPLTERFALVDRVVVGPDRRGGEQEDQCSEAESHGGISVLASRRRAETCYKRLYAEKWYAVKELPRSGEAQAARRQGALGDLEQPLHQQRHCRCRQRSFEDQTEIVEANAREDRLSVPARADESANGCR